MEDISTTQGIPAIMNNLSFMTNKFLGSVDRTLSTNLTIPVDYIESEYDIHVTTDYDYCNHRNVSTYSTEYTTYVTCRDCGEGWEE